MEKTMQLAFEAFMVLLLAINAFHVRQRAKRVRDVRAFHQLHGRKGNWDQGAYNRGLYNGLELALATLEERDPQFREMSLKERAEK